MTDWLMVLPWLTAAGAGAALFRQVVVAPWIAARQKQDALAAERVDRLVVEMEALRGDLRRLSGDMYELRKDVAAMVARPLPKEGL